MSQIGIGIIGTGQIALANHLTGFAACPMAKVVALCDNKAQILEKARLQTGITAVYAHYEHLIADSRVEAVVICTPNDLHVTQVLAAIQAGKHVLCEKPLGLNYAQTLAMYEAASAAKVRHMTAFTYRFVPAMRYIDYLVKSGAIGQPYHFRANRLQDWGNRPLGWRQVKDRAGSGELGDMLSHRIDYGLMLVGKVSRLVASTRQILTERGGQPSELEDWVAIMADFENGTTGLWESSKLAFGHGEGLHSQDYCELNGSEGSLIYMLERPNEIQIAKLGSSGLQTQAVPNEFLKAPNSPRNIGDGDPSIVFRYDQAFEFVDAIANERDCQPSFLDGLRVQAVMDAALLSAQNNQWQTVESL